MYDDHYSYPRRGQAGLRAQSGRYNQESSESDHEEEEEFDDGVDDFATNRIEGERDVHNDVYTHDVPQSSSTFTYVDHETYDNVSAAQVSYESAVASYRRSKTEEKLDKYGDKLDDAVDLASKVHDGYESIAPTVQNYISSDKTGKQLEDTVHDFLYGIPDFIEVLEEIGKVVPFLGFVVSAFSTVYKYEKARQSSDQKVMVVFVEMKEMLRILLRLRDTEGIPEEDSKKLRELCDKTADDIKACGNACDTYSKKSFASKLIGSRTWDKRFTEFIDNFHKRRKEFDFALSMSTQFTMLEVHQRLKSMEQKNNEVLSILRDAWPPEVRKYMKILNENKNNDEQLKATLKAHPFLYMTDVEARSKTKESELANKKLLETIAELKEGTHDTLQDEEKNRKKFEQLFELQKKQIEEVKNVVARESDRTREELAKAIKGPVDKIVDKDIYAIWLEGGWKGNVKARHFILALRDYFHERHETDRRANMQDTNPTMSDKWAFQYIDVPYLQPILEAIDDDASGFIRIAEVNAFTTSRPKDWSLPRWIAFWAVGWYSNAQTECSKINETFEEMFSLLEDIKKENQMFAEGYLRAVWKEVSELTMSLEAEEHRPNELDNIFAPYIETEETRLKSSLELINYDIDDLGTLEVVIGTGRVEKHVFLLLRLILERHLKLFKLCKDYVLHSYELIDAAESILWVMNAVRARHQDLKTLFNNQRLDPKLQLQVFEYGIFRYIDNPQSLWPGGLSVCQHMRGQDDLDSDTELEEEDGSDDGQLDGDEEDSQDTHEGIPQSADDPTAILIYPHQDENDLSATNFDYGASFGFYCDCCNEFITKNRIICMDCVSSEGLWNTVDFCTKPSCVRRQSVVGRADLLKEHTPQHNLLMLGQIPHVLLVLIATYEKGDDSIYEEAMKKIRQTQNVIGESLSSFAYHPAERQYTPSIPSVPYYHAQQEIRSMSYPSEQQAPLSSPYPDQGYEQSISPPCCAGCHNPITLPCWACLECPAEDKKEHADNIEPEDADKQSGERYICLNCIDRAEELDDRYHMFVRCPAKVQDNSDDSIESVIMSLRDRLTLVEASQNRLEGRLETLLGRLEAILPQHNAPHHYPAYYQSPGYPV